MLLFIIRLLNVSHCTTSRQGQAICFALIQCCTDWLIFIFRYAGIILYTARIDHESFHSVITRQILANDHYLTASTFSNKEFRRPCNRARGPPKMTLVLRIIPTVDVGFYEMPYPLYCFSRGSNPPFHISLSPLVFPLTYVWSGTRLLFL